MALKLRPTGLGAGIDKERADFSVYCGEWGVGRFYETRGAVTPAGFDHYETAVRAPVAPIVHATAGTISLQKVLNAQRKSILLLDVK